MSGALVLALDPVPGDEVAVAAATLITAVVAWVGYEIYQFAHVKKKQSTGKSGADSHARQYKHGGKNRPENPNKRKKADDHRNKGKEVN